MVDLDFDLTFCGGFYWGFLESFGRHIFSLLPCYKHRSQWNRFIKRKKKKIRKKKSFCLLFLHGFMYTNVLSLAKMEFFWLQKENNFSRFHGTSFE